MESGNVLFTGGSGLLGGEMKKLLPQALFPASSEFNVTHYEGMEEYLRGKQVRLVLHAAAFTSPPKVDREPLRAVEANIIGTANVVRLCGTHGLKLIYISTDYVFPGDRGRYAEDDAVLPVNKYAWSKLGGECAVRLLDDALIVRTSFGPNVFPYEKAFGDQWTSRESVAQIAKKIVSLLDRDLRGVIHVGGPRRTVFEYACSLSPEKKIENISIRDMSFAIPKDTSLNCEKYGSLI
jgi:dTDP-4-dehydrorhamnose reductase